MAANFFDEEWDYSSLGKIFFSEEEDASSSSATDLMLQFFHGEDDDATAAAAAAALFTNGCHDDTIFWPVINNQNVATWADGTTNFTCSDAFLDYNNNFQNVVVSQESSSGSEGGFFPNQLPDFNVNNFITDRSMDLSSSPLMIGIQETTDSQLRQNAINVVTADVESEMQLKKRKFDSTSDDGGLTTTTNNNNNTGTECSQIPNNKKNNKSRVARRNVSTKYLFLNLFKLRNIYFDTTNKYIIQTQKNKKNAEPIKSKKKQKQIVNSKEEDEEENGQNIIGQSSSSCYSSDDDSNASQESNADEKTIAPALNLNGKTRATRGAATDPQSLYARVI